MNNNKLISPMNPIPEMVLAGLGLLLLNGGLPHCHAEAGRLGHIRVHGYHAEARGTALRLDSLLELLSLPDFLASSHPLAAPVEGDVGVRLVRPYLLHLVLHKLIPITSRINFKSI